MKLAVALGPGSRSRRGATSSFSGARKAASHGRPLRPPCEARLRRLRPLSGRPAPVAPSSTPRRSRTTDPTAALRDGLPLADQAHESRPPSGAPCWLNVSWPWEGAIAGAPQTSEAEVPEFTRMGRAMAPQRAVPRKIGDGRRLRRRDPILALELREFSADPGAVGRPRPTRSSRPEHCDGERRQGVQAAEPAPGGRPQRAAVREPRRAPGSAGRLRKALAGVGLGRVSRRSTLWRSAF